jgi:hypothetical protein
MKIRRLLAAVAAVATFGTAGVGAALADQLAFDGDGLLPFGGSNASVTACTTAPTTFDVIIAAQRKGNANSGGVFKDGSTVSVTFSSATAGMSATLSDSTITIPSGWETSSTNVVSTDTVTATVTLPAQSRAASGTVAFAYSGSNSTGATVSGTSSIQVSWTMRTCDQTAPVLSLPSDLNAEATSAGGATVDFTATATDETAPAHPAVTCAPTSGSTFPLGATTVSCSATDSAGNTARGSFKVTVADTTPPAISALSNIDLEAESAGTEVTWDDPTAFDAVSGSVPVSCSPSSGSPFAVGTSTVKCTAIDDAGNKGSASFKITVSDTTGPILVLPADATAEATGPSGANVPYTVSATDLVDGAIAPICAPASGSTFSLGTTTVNCSATDDAGNRSAGSFNVTVKDTTAPDVTAPDSVTAEATSSAGATVTYGAATANDLVDGDVEATCTPVSGSTFALGTTTVTCSATDAHNNTGSATFDVTVQDTTGPEITVPDRVIAEATGSSGAIVTFTTSATDLVDGVVETTCSPASGSIFALGGTQVDCTAVDSRGNSTTESFAVIVQDTTAPVVTAPESVIAEATSSAGATVTYGAATAKDLVDGVVEATCAPVSGSTFALGTTTVTCSATDAHNNTGSATFDITVQDTTGPEISWVGGPADGASFVFGSVPAAPTCTATDLVSGTVDCAVTGYGTNTGQHTLTATATDKAGNTTTATRSYTVNAWVLGGFYRPVDLGGVLNKVKAGSTVPLKFNVLAGSTELTATSAVKSFVQTKVACDSSAVLDEIPLSETTTGGTTLRYDSTGGQFIQNWQTPKAGAGSCYRVTMTTLDGSTISANFQLK